MRSFDLLSIGNVTVDIFLSIPDANEHFGITANKELVLKIGDKIHLEKYDISIGGDASNVAIGVARLGFSTTLAAETGYDEFLPKITKTLEKEGVDQSLLRRGEEKESCFSVIINYKGDRIIFAEERQREHKFDFTEIEAKTVYLTSLGKQWIDAYEKALLFAEQNYSKLIFNPGAHQIEEKNEIVGKILKRCDLIFLNKEEAELLIGENPLEIRELVQKIKAIGPKEVVITNGAEGSYFLDSRGVLHKAGLIHTEVVERTGAGDAFASGFISAMLNGLSSEERLFWGSANSASVIGQLGAIAGLLSKEEMDQRKNSITNFKVEVI